MNLVFGSSLSVALFSFVEGDYDKLLLVYIWLYGVGECKNICKIKILKIMKLRKCLS